MLKSNILSSTLFLLLISSTASAQIEDLKNKVYETKLAKSPAKAEIEELDRKIDLVEDYRNESAEAIYKAMNRKSALVNRFVKEFEKADELIPIVQSKDPKWKIEKQIEKLELHRQKFNEVVKLQAEFEALQLSYRNYYNIFNDKKNRLEGLWKSVEMRYDADRGSEVDPHRMNAATNFYAYVTATDSTGLDWDNFKSLKTKALEVNEKYVKELKSFGGNIDESDYGYKALYYFSEENEYGLKNNFEKFLKIVSNTEAYSLKPDFWKTAYLLNASKSDKLMLDAWMKLYPENSELQALQSKVANYANTLASTFKSEIAVSDFHNEIVQGVYFSNHPIEFGKESAADFQTTFKSTDAIYMVQYFPTKRDLSVIKSEIRPKNSPNTIDLKFINDELKSASAIQIMLVQDANNLDLPRYYETFRLVSYLHDTEASKIELDIDKSIITIDATEGKQNYTTINEAFSTYRKKVLPLPEADSEVLPAGIEQACKAHGFTEKLVKSHAYSKWEYTKSYLGVILRRDMEAALYFKDAQGNCFFRIVAIRQEAIGSGYAQPEIYAADYLYFQTIKGGYEIKHEQSESGGIFYYNCR